MKAQINTSKGNISFNLFYNEAPLTVSNFVNLSKRGYYNNLTFHRVIENFMIQGGCPMGTGTGGPGYEFKDEFNPSLKHDRPGILSMANSGPGTNGSQFFITHIETPWLDNNHTIFGCIDNDTSQSVINNIVVGDIISSINIQGSIGKDKSITDQINTWNAILDKH